MATTITANGINFPDGSASAPSIGGTDTNTGLFTGSDIVGFATGGVERIKIDAQGDIFIGTTSDIAPANGTNLCVSDGTISRLILEKQSTIKFGLNVSTGFTIYDETNDAARFSITSTGVIQTGTAIGASGSDGNQRLVVGRDGDCNIAIRATGSTTASTGIDFGDSGDDRSGRIQYMHNGDYMSFHTNGAGSGSSNEKLRITSAGRVGIGLTAPAVALDVQGGTSNTGIAVRSTDTRAQVSYIDNATTGIGCVCTGGQGDDFFIRTGSDGAKKLTIKADGKVGIGTTAPGEKLHVAGNIINTENIASTGDSGIMIGNGHRLGFDQSGTRSWTVKAQNGVLNVASGDGASAPRVAGLLFGSDTAAANTLDDYEEGTWSPSVTFGSGSTGLGLNNSSGYYTKVGRLVNVGGTIIFSSRGSSTGDAELVGLPFTIGNNDATTSAEGGGFFTYWTNMSTDKLDWTLRGTHNTTTAAISVSRSGGHTAIDNAVSGDFSSTTSIRFVMTYQT